MSKAVSSGKYGVVVMADLELLLMQSGEMEQYRSCIKEVLKKNILSAFDSFVCEQLSRNLVNTYSSNWVQTHTGVPQGSLSIPFIFLVYTSDLTMQEEKPDSNYTKNDQHNKDPRESKYGNDVELWRLHSSIYNY